MQIRALHLVVAGVVIGLGLSGGVAVAMASSTGSDDYVNEDGTVDMSKIPDTMTMVDANGDIVVDKNGNPVLLDARRLLDPTADDPFKDRYPQGKALTQVGPDGKREVVGQEGVPIPQADLIEEYGVTK